MLHRNVRREPGTEDGRMINKDHVTDNDGITNFDELEGKKVRKTSLSRKTNLLEMEGVNYEVQDVDKPNLFREFFEYVEVPKVGFNFRTSPYDMPEEILITDSTFRDGQQSREPYTTKQIVDIFKLISRSSRRSRHGSAQRRKTSK